MASPTMPASVLPSEQNGNAYALAQELFGMVRRLGELGLHREAQSVQEQANVFWMKGLGHKTRRALPA